MSRSGHRRFRWSAIKQAAADLPRWLLAGAILVAPSYYGATTAHSVFATDALLAAAVILWAIVKVVTARKITVPIPLLIAGGVVVAQGWLAVWSARSLHDPDYQSFVALTGSMRGLPASIDRGMSLQWMIRGTLLICVTWFVADLSRRRSWVLRIWCAVGVVGGCIAALGLLQKATGAMFPFRPYPPDYHWTRQLVFGTFYYHANAGAFLNLTLPLATGLTLRAAQLPRAYFQRALWLTATLLIVLGCAVNTSRMAQVLALAVIIALTVGPCRRYLGPRLRSNRAAALGGAALVLLVVIVVAQVSHAEKPIERWREEMKEVPTDARWTAQRLAIGALSEVGLFGFGPGTFAAAFPQFEARAGIASAGEWQDLHEDYLQAILEWGWLGSLCWAVIFFGGIAAGVVALRRSRGIRPTPRIARLLPLLLISLCATAVHSLVDFPLQVLSLQLLVAIYIGLCWGSLAALSDYTRPD